MGPVPGGSLRAGQAKVCQDDNFSFYNDGLFRRGLGTLENKEKASGEKGNTTESWHNHSSVATELWRGSKVGLGDIQAQFSNLAVQGGPVDAQQTGGFGLVAAGLPQGLEDTFGGREIR